MRCGAREENRNLQKGFAGMKKYGGKGSAAGRIIGKMTSGGLISVEETAKCQEKWVRYVMFPLKTPHN